MRRLPPNWFPDNAIMRAERSHQERATNNQRRWRRYVQRAVNWGMLTIGMILFWGEFAGALAERDASTIGQKLGVLTVIFVAYTVIWHFSLLFRTLALAANSIAREKQSGSWDLLVLTGVDARQIVRGKWWATIQQQLPHYVRLGLLRACAAIYWIAANSRAFLYAVYTPYYGWPNVNIVLPEPIGILLAGIIVFIFTIVNLFFTAACGIQASAQTQRPASALIWSIVGRFTVPFIPLLFILCLVIAGPLRYSTSNSLAAVLGGTSMTLIDNGVNVIYEFVAVHYQWNDTFSTTRSPFITIVEIFTAIILALSIYALFTFLLIRRAERLAVDKSNALPPQKRFSAYQHPVIP